MNWDQFMVSWNQFMDYWKLLLSAPYAPIFMGASVLLAGFVVYAIISVTISGICDSAGPEGIASYFLYSLACGGVILAIFIWPDSAAYFYYGGALLTGLGICAICCIPFWS